MATLFATGFEEDDVEYGAIGGGLPYRNTSEGGANTGTGSLWCDGAGSLGDGFYFSTGSGLGVSNFSEIDVSFFVRWNWYDAAHESDIIGRVIYTDASHDDTTIASLDDSDPFNEYFPVSGPLTANPGKTIDEIQIRIVRTAGPEWNEWGVDDVLIEGEPDPPQLRSYSSAASGTCTAPAGLAEGDVLVAIAWYIGEIDTTGWDEIVSTTVSTAPVVALKQVVDTPAADYTIPVVGDPGSNIVLGVALLRITGSDGSIDGTPVTSPAVPGTGNPMVFDPITTATANAVLIAWGKGTGTRGYESPFESMFSYSNTALGDADIAHGVLASPGSTGPLTLTTTGGVWTGGMAFAIAGDEAPDPPPVVTTRRRYGLLLPV